MIKSVLKYKIIIALTSSLFFGGIIRLNLPSKKSNSEIIKEFWIRKTHLNSKKDIVVAGNSRIYRGVSIEAMKNSLTKNLSGVNLGYSALGYSTDYLEYLESRIDLSSKYKILLFGIGPGTFTKIAAENKSFKQYKNVTKADVFKTLYINPYFNLPAYSPTEIIDLLVSPNNSNGFIEVRENYFGKYNEDGWVASYKVPGNPDEALPIYERFWSKNDSALDEKLISDFFIKLEEFREKGIIVIAFRPPSTESMQNWEDEQFKFNESYFKDRIEKIGGFWININTTRYTSYDGAHLHYKSAEELSRHLGQKINEIYQKENIFN